MQHATQCLSVVNNVLNLHNCCCMIHGSEARIFYRIFVVTIIIMQTARLTAIITEKLLQNSIMRHSGISDFLEGRPCPEPNIFASAAYGENTYTSCYTQSGCNRIGTQSGTRETPPTDTFATTQPGEGVSPLVDPEFLPTSSSSVVGSMLTTERS